jgi:hypothetical protein
MEQLRSSLKSLTTAIDEIELALEMAKLVDADGDLDAAYEIMGEALSSSKLAFDNIETLLARYALAKED